MKVTPEFLRLVQDAGWIIKSVTQAEVLGDCPNPGCDMRATLQPGKPVRKVCGASTDKEVELTGFDQGRRYLRKRRDDLTLTIDEVEVNAGLAVSYLAKFERDNPSKIPNVATFVDLCNSLGLGLYLRPKPLPLKTLRCIADTRSNQKDREAYQRQHVLRRSDAE